MLIPTHLNRYYLKAAKVVTADAVLLDHVVLVEQGKITAITKQIAPEIEVIDLGEHSLFPGFIDLHIHGREGCDIMDGTPESLEIISRSLAKHGVTGFVGTTGPQTGTSQFKLIKIWRVRIKKAWLERSC